MLTLDKKHTARIVRNARKTLGWTQKRLGEELHIHLCTISKIETPSHKQTIRASDFMWLINKAMSRPQPKPIFYKYTPINGDTQI